MSKLNDGGPAFPRPLSMLSPEEFSHEQDGMSLRDWMASQAMIGLFMQQGLTTQRPFTDTEEKCASLAAVAYQIADAMLHEREKS